MSSRFSMQGLIRQLILLFSCLFSVVVLAQPPQPAQLLPGPETPPSVRIVEESSVQIDRRQASELAKRRFEGRVLNIRLENGRWRVRMDNKGTVFNVYVNARSGEVSGQNGRR